MHVDLSFAWWFLGLCPRPYKGRRPLTLQGSSSLDPFWGFAPVFLRVVENLWKAWKTSIEFSTEVLKNQGFEVFHTLVSTTCSRWGKPKILPPFWAGFWRKSSSLSHLFSFFHPLSPNVSRLFPFGIPAPGTFPHFIPRGEGRFSQFVLMVKPLSCKGWRVFSTTSTAPTTTTKL